MNYNIKYLIGGEGNFYKANLHSRSSLSDGRLSPEELKRLYKDNGYSVLAITDNKPEDYSSLSDADFLMLSGFDFGAKADVRAGVPTKSSTFTALSLNSKPKNVPVFDAKYGTDKVNEFISEYKKNGYFVTYDHPIRSLETMPDFMKYECIDAVEIMNYSSLCEGYDEYNSFTYDLFLRHGRKISCIATDGNRNLRPLDSERSDSLGAFTVINADSLKYDSIAKSLSEGRFYSSEAPEIKAMWVKGDSLNVRCSPADKIILSAGRRAVRCVYKNQNAPLTGATFKISEADIYVRITVIDAEGKRAYTNAYYLDELFS
ncbi:MAG: hypothetical protein IKB23_05120 [Clostridia bacterium]|nr:hypothetical protein [Clostridia bacterium]